MNRWLTRVVIAGILLQVAGCSSAGEYGSWVPPSVGAQADCERSGGVWRTALNFCEHPRAAVPEAVVAVPQPPEEPAAYPKLLATAQSQTTRTRESSG
jgi:hypothetical protein